MKRLSLALASAVLALALAPIAQAAPQSAFTGSWYGLDPAPPAGDGSALYLEISGGTNVRISFTDAHGHICVTNQAPTVVFSSQLVGTVNGDELDAAFVFARCGSVAFGWLEGVPTTYVYDATTDTLWDGYATYYRR